MEEEIRVLESCWVMTTDHVLDEGNIALKLAIKNFIKGYKQLEKENAELRKNQCTHNIDNECLRKSVIREYKDKFIEDSKNKTVFMTQSSQINASLISFCNELLGGK